MTARIRAFGVPLALALVLPGSAMAQKGGVELGMDMALSHNMIDQSDDNVTSITLPVGGGFAPALSPQTGLRATFHVSDVFAIEPVTTFSYFKEGDSNLTSLSLALKGQYHFSKDVTAARWYVGGGGTFSLVDAGSSDTETQFGLTIELGGKFPLKDYLGLRLAGGYTRMFETESLTAQDVLFLAFGFSVTMWD